ncbi:MAG: four helix bundle protein [Chitinophagaceae bacterium]|nr:four helix bundle protein [Chitinophagaceae bacterium]MBL0055257.1 four helix bundle protein [Chitinophagaceae bacterium]
MDSEEMKRRTKMFAINVALLTQKLKPTVINRAYSGQIVRSSSSVGANYRASRRAKSNADFINKLKIVEEELDESLFFLELLEFFNEKEKSEIELLLKEGETLLKIIVASIISSRK